MTTSWRIAWNLFFFLVFLPGPNILKFREVRERAGRGSVLLASRGPGLLHDADDRLGGLAHDLRAELRGGHPAPATVPALPPRLGQLPALCGAPAASAALGQCHHQPRGLGFGRFRQARKLVGVIEF